MKRKDLFFVVLFFSISSLFAQENTGEYVGREVANIISAVKGANPGDFIVLPSGRRYVLTQEEIDIINGRFDFSDLSGVASETTDDGTEIITLSEAHKVFVYPDGQSTHMLRTAGSFTRFMQEYVERYYILGQYVDILGNRHDAGPNGSPRFYVFRAGVQIQTISDGANDVQRVIVTVFNYFGENFIMRYYSADGFEWGNVRGGTFVPIGEPRHLEFDIE